RTRQWKVACVRCSACIEVESIAADVILLLALEIGEPRHVAGAADEAAGALAVLRLRNDSHYAIGNVELIVEVVAKDTARIGDLRVQQESSALEAGGSNYYHTRPGVKLSVRSPVNEVCPADKAGPLVDGDLAHDGVRNQIEIAGRQSCRQKEIERARQLPVSQRTPDLGNRHPFRLACGRESLRRFAVGRVILDEEPIG